MAKVDKIIKELYKKATKVMTSAKFGFPKDEVDDYLTVEASDIKDGIKVEVRAEVDMDGMYALADALNPIVTKYDKEAYFDMVAPGIMESFITTIESINSAWDEPEYIEIWDEDRKYEIEFDNIIDVVNGSFYLADNEQMEEIYDRELDAVIVSSDEVAWDILGLLEFEIPDDPGQYRISGIAKLKYTIDGLYEGVDINGQPATIVEDATVRFDPKGSWVENFQIEKL